MYSTADLYREIDEEIVSLESQNAPRLHPDWIAQSVLARHPDIAGDDTAFYVCAGRACVRDAVRVRLNRYKARPQLEADRQTVLEGFERLQRHYLCSEDGTQVAILVHEMSDAQLEAKAAELRAMGVGCYQHADEIERYRAQRQQAA